MKCQNLFSEKSKKNVENVVCLDFYPACYTLIDCFEISLSPMLSRCQFSGTPRLAAVSSD